jgi:hypothetical protein
MTIQDLKYKAAVKAQKTQEISEKIESIRKKISANDLEIEQGILNGSADDAVILTKQKRDLQDELSILERVKKNVEAAPAFTVEDIYAAWDQYSGAAAEEMLELVRSMEQAYQAYSETFTAVLDKNKAASDFKKELVLLGQKQGITDIRIRTPFTKIDLDHCVPDRTILGKLNLIGNEFLGEAVF